MIQCKKFINKLLRSTTVKWQQLKIDTKDPDEEGAILNECTEPKVTEIYHLNV